jgi:flotillin
MNTVLLVIVVAFFVVIVFLVCLAMILKSYVKAPANRAFVRTGGFFRAPDARPKVVMNGGSWVFGFIHEITWVDLGTMAIEIERTEQNALLTRDPQYADIRAIFYIKVSPTIEGIIDAARTIGDRVVDSQAVKQLVDAKLDGALRDVAATFTLMSLHQERENFIKEVQNRVKGDLEENGLILESVSILTLKAARQGSFGTDDVFGAQVARANAEVIQTALRERNDIERRTEVEIKQRDTNTSKEKLTLEQDLAFAAATQEREVRARQALEKASAEKLIYEQEQSAEQARIAKERAIKLSEIEMEQTILVQSERKNQEFQAAEIQRNQAIEVANQAKQIAVLTEQQKREAAEKELLMVAAQREQASQDVITVQETAKANREAQIQVIEAERDAKREMIDRKNVVEIEALKKVREAEAQARALKEIAQAEFEAAQKQAETKRTQAQAESDAEKMQADAERARTSAAGLAEAEVLRAKAEAARLQGTAEAEVIKAKAEATQTEADVIRAKGLAEAAAVKAKGLAEAEGEKAKAEALAAFDNVSQKLELQRLQLEAQIQVGVARAQAMGAAIANMQIKMFGTPEAADSILRLMSFAEGLNDVIGAVPAPLRELGGQLLGKMIGSNDQQNGQPVTLDELAGLMPRILAVIERTLDVNKLKPQTVREVLEQLEGQAAAEDQPLVARARAALALLPLLADMKFEDVYLRYTAG